MPPHSHRKRLRSCMTEILHSKLLPSPRLRGKEGMAGPHYSSHRRGTPPDFGWRPYPDSVSCLHHGLGSPSLFCSRMHMLAKPLRFLLIACACLAGPLIAAGCTPHEDVPAAQQTAGPGEYLFCHWNVENFF